ncbi:helix-turn-helix transcriptional regulator [Brevibacillus daliensis]|uniref:helix-turn-helix transcriptional regulator n=1 Tax=Brevibacillus daliensis TaxID=2892995 RepID=UPI001E5C20E9|nr:PAS domain-containing protein [Brevibacillus daliensis]
MNRVESFIPLVSFLAGVLGKNTEVVLHDLRTPDNSIVAIENGHVSGRKTGGPLTDLVLKVIQDGSYKEKDYLVNYISYVKGNRRCRSSSFFIKDEVGEIVGLLCINMDVSAWEQSRELITQMIFGFQEEQGITENQKDQESNSNKISTQYSQQHNQGVFENLQETVEDVLISMIDKVLVEFDITPERMSVEEKMEVVRRLHDQGLFLLKGGVNELSKKMKVSEATVYRYLSKVKE